MNVQLGTSWVSVEQFSSQTQLQLRLGLSFVVLELSLWQFILLCLIMNVLRYLKGTSWISKGILLSSLLLSMLLLHVMMVWCWLLTFKLPSTEVTGVTSPPGVEEDSLLLASTLCSIIGMGVLEKIELIFEWWIDGYTTCTMDSNHEKQIFNTDPPTGVYLL